MVFVYGSLLSGEPKDALRAPGIAAYALVDLGACPALLGRGTTATCRTASIMLVG